VAYLPGLSFSLQGLSSEGRRPPVADDGEGQWEGSLQQLWEGLALSLAVHVARGKCLEGEDSVYKI